LLCWLHRFLSFWRLSSARGPTLTLMVFVPFAMVYMDQPFKLDDIWAALCLAGAVYFIFRA
jgi:uncharacterized protein (DUF486 family)